MDSNALIIVAGLMAAPLASVVTWLLTRQQRRMDVNVSMGQAWGSLVAAQGESVATGQALLESISAELTATRQELVLARADLAETKLELGTLREAYEHQSAELDALRTSIADVIARIEEPHPSWIQQLKHLLNKEDDSHVGSDPE